MDRDILFVLVIITKKKYWRFLSFQFSDDRKLKSRSHILLYIRKLLTRFGWAKVLKFHPVLLFSCLLDGQKLKLAEIYLNPNLARFDKISTNWDRRFNGVTSHHQCKHCIYTLISKLSFSLRPLIRFKILVKNIKRFAQPKHDLNTCINSISLICKMCSQVKVFVNP